jgi:hypothetical protein
VLVGLIGDPITDVTPVYAWVHTLIVDAMDRHGLHRDLVPVVGAGRKYERSCRGRGRWQRCPWSHVGCREEGRDKKGRRMGSVRIGRENCWVWLRDQDLHPPSLSIRQVRWSTHRHILGYRLRSKRRRIHQKTPWSKPKLFSTD